MVKVDEIWTLTVLPYFCVLVHRSETVWFIKGHGIALLLSIRERFDPYWHKFLAWPEKQIDIVV